MTQFLSEETISKGELSRLSDLVDKQLHYERDVEIIEEELKKAKERYNAVRQQEIPDFLSQFGISEIRLADGRKVTVKPDVNVTVKDAKAFYAFLKERHDDAIIKSVLEMDNPSTELMDELMDRGYMYQYAEKIHGQTLKAYFRRFLEVGDTPPDSVNVFTFSVAKIK